MKRILVAGIVIIIIAGGLTFLYCKNGQPKFDSANRELQYLVADMVARNKSVKNCVLAVAKGDGSFAWSGAAGTADGAKRIPMTPDTPIFLASITKLYTATAVMRLYERGVLSLDDPIAKHLPEDVLKDIHVYEGKDFSRDITVRHLLGHTSGIADYYTGKAGDGKSLYEHFLADPKRLWTVRETIDHARKNLKPNFPPGKDAAYSDTNYQLLGLIVESATGRPLHAVFEEYFFGPLNLRRTRLAGSGNSCLAATYDVADTFDGERRINDVRCNGSYWADGGMVSTAEEAIVFLRALNEGRIVRRDTLKLMQDWHGLEFPISYGFGMMYFRFPPFMARITNVPPLWGHSGSTGSFLYYDPDHDLYLAGTINQTESKIKPFLLMGKAIRALEIQK